MIDFKLEGREFIELDNLLKVTSLCGSGGLTI
jgi:ribosome-associated protein YbcJ (S4-like RNA binding protein)